MLLKWEPLKAIDINVHRRWLAMRRSKAAKKTLLSVAATSTAIFLVLFLLVDVVRHEDRPTEKAGWVEDETMESRVHHLRETCQRFEMQN